EAPGRAQPGGGALAVGEPGAAGAAGDDVEAPAAHLHGGHGEVAVLVGGADMEGAGGERRPIAAVGGDAAAGSALLHRPGGGGVGGRAPRRAGPQAGGGRIEGDAAATARGRLGGAPAGAIGGADVAARALAVAATGIAAAGGMYAEAAGEEDDRDEPAH